MILSQLAKEAVENYIKEGKIINPKNLSQEYFSQRKGVFVTIKFEKESKNGKKESFLRGCIGTYLPLRENIVQEVISNAIAAATEDYRFEKIREEELPYLSYVVYILNEPEEVSSLEELNPKKYGIIVKSQIISSNNALFNGHQSFKTGLLLPDLPEINTVEEQFFYACKKGEIDPQKEKIRIYRFTVEKDELNIDS